MFAVADGEEMARQVGQVLEIGSSGDPVEDIKKLGGLWASARLRFKDIDSSELSAAWGKIVKRACDGQLRSHEAWVKQLLRDSAPTGEIVRVEEHLAKLQEVSQFKWVNIEAEL